MSKPPIILTLSVEEKTSLFFNLLRKKYFPASRNFIDAHLTLFHALPNEIKTFEAVKNLCDSQIRFKINITDVVSIGKGVAYKIDSKELMQIHSTLKNGWHHSLSLQDQQKLWPHITVQNKVPLQEAKQLLDTLKKGFEPFSTWATGLQLWEYLNGPWKFVDCFPFKEL